MTTTLATEISRRFSVVDQISTPAGVLAPQVKVRSPLDSVDPLRFFVQAPPVQGKGLISAQDLAKGVFVNGHSLGGYLATAFTRLFGEQANVQHTTTFNSAGFTVWAGSAFEQLESLLPAGDGLRRFPTAQEQTNYLTQYGPSVTTNDWYFSQKGERVGLFNEQSTNPMDNHSMYKVTDMLALGKDTIKTSQYAGGMPWGAC